MLFVEILPSCDLSDTPSFSLNELWDLKMCPVCGQAAP